MTHVRIKMLVAGLVLLASVGYLAVAGVKSGWVYYMHVDDFVQDTSYQARRVRLFGLVSKENVDVQPAMLTASFDLHGEKVSLPVHYQGVVPDTFKPGGEVMVEGKLDDAGVFQADTLMTKCASKYQSEEHAKRLEAAR
ncbi:MAG: cytochrome c maturation protein CcmE [Phycisphaerales bacterium]